MEQQQQIPHFDVIIVGAGLSGIGAAHHLKDNCPDRTYTILEARAAIGGTWDLFRYPGIRSDSDMFTLGYSFKPWKEQKAIADGPSILKYIKETAKEGDIEKKIRFHHKVKNAAWSSEASKWIVEAERTDTGQKVQISCNFLHMCSGYYSYENGYTPDFKNLDKYEGRFVHPQKWTSDINYDNKKVVVIGSGATAVTLVPEMAKKAEKVTMLQRSPTYVITMPAKDVVSNFLRKILPAKVAYFLSRWKNVTFSLGFYKLARSKPNFTKKLIMKGVKKELNDDFDVDTHFNPSYKPWDQRLCMVPDSDLFESINSGKADIVTDHVASFYDKGINLRSGKKLEADLVVSATGLNLTVLGNLKMKVDGQEINYANHLTYRGMMLSDIPNFAISMGYTNASWTLKADLTCEYICRLLNHMKNTGAQQCTPKITDPNMLEEPIIDFNSGYVTRSINNFPKQGSKRPWKVFQNYFLDIFNFRYSSLKDDSLEFK